MLSYIAVAAMAIRPAVKYLNTPLDLHRLGFITEGYNPRRDVYERTYSFGPIKRSVEVTAFGKSRKSKVIRGTQANPKYKLLAETRSSGRITLEKPGMRITFKDKADFVRNRHKIAEHPGFNKHPTLGLLMSEEGVNGLRVYPASLAVAAKAVHGLSANRLPL